MSLLIYIYETLSSAVPPGNLVIMDESRRVVRGGRAGKSLYSCFTGERKYLREYLEEILLENHYFRCNFYGVEFHSD